MIKIFNKEINLFNSLSTIILLMGLFIILAQAYYYFKYNSPFVDKVTILGLLITCFGYYNIFIK